MWHKYFNNLPRHTKFSLGTKIDEFFTDCIELSLLAGYANKKDKLEFIQKLSSKFDALKFFLKIIWEIKGITDQKYTNLTILLTPIGKMIGGWQNHFKI